MRRDARWGVVANGSNGEMRSLCTIDLNPIVLRDSMLFSLLFNDRVAVKPGNRVRNMGPWPLRANRPRDPALPSESAKWLGSSGPAHSRRRRSPLFFCMAPNPSSRRSGCTAQINKRCGDTPDCPQSVCPPAAKIPRAYPKEYFVYRIEARTSLR